MPCREKFTSAHISWLRAQGDTGGRSRQYFEEAEIDMYLLWTRVVQHGGMDCVSACNPLKRLYPKLTRPCYLTFCGLTSEYA